MKPLAIKVQNKKQFNALMDYYKMKGWSGVKSQDLIFELNLFSIIEYNDIFLRMDESNTMATKQYDVISFDAFSTLMGIRVVEEIEMTGEGLSISLDKDGATIGASPSRIVSMSFGLFESVYTAFKSLQDA